MNQRVYLLFFTSHRKGSVCAFMHNHSCAAPLRLCQGDLPSVALVYPVLGGFDLSVDARRRKEAVAKVHNTCAGVHMS